VRGLFTVVRGRTRSGRSSVTAPLAFRLLPPLSPALRARRLLSLTLRDLRRLATAPKLPRSDDWDGRVLGRLTALPDQAEPLQRAQLVAALWVGAEIIQLRQMAPSLGAAAELDAALEAVALGNSASAIEQLRQLDRRLASSLGSGQKTQTALRARGRILVIYEALAEQSSYFDAGAPA
jgi:Fusaric acid resistance protein family